MSVLGRRRFGLVGFVSVRGYLHRRALYRGVVRGSKGWIVLGMVMAIPTVTKRLLGKTEVLVAREKLRPGQFVRVEALKDLPRAERKAILKATK